MSIFYLFINLNLIKDNDQANPNAIFIADAMLGKLARKLRILGFDTLYIKEIEDDEILDIGIKEKRIILTSDKQLSQRISKLECNGILVNYQAEIDNLANIFLYCKIANLKYIPNVYSRCALCNGQIFPIEKELVDLSAVPLKVLQNNKTFFTCSFCHKLYWNGIHVKKINDMVTKLNELL